MNELAQQWLTERVSQPGTLACALRHPDGNFMSQSVDAFCPATTIESILANFEALAAAAGEATAPQWSTWAFEEGQLRLVERPDGWRFVLVVRNESEAASALDAVSQEFLTISFDG